MPSERENLISIALEYMLKGSVEGLRQRTETDQVRITLATREARLMIAGSLLDTILREMEARGTRIPHGTISSYQEIYTDQAFQCRVDYREPDRPLEPEAILRRGEEEPTYGNDRNETRWDHI